MPFTPKFVDLVRNVTNVQGTGPVTLGAAVAGFTSLAVAAATGEQFYYCIQDVNKPAEREVGRGTMQADGTVAREAISGSLTSFGNGAKTIALVAAAEWFTRLNQGGSAAAPFDVASRASLAATGSASARPAYLAEAGREGLFVFERSDQSALIAADIAQGMSIAPASDPSGASGAWLRKHDGPLRLEWFGAVPGDYATGVGADCLPAWEAAMSYLDAVKRNVSVANFAGAAQILFTAAQYYFSDTLQIKRTLRLTGMGSGQAGGEPTWLRFPADKAGIVVNRSNTLGDAEDSPATTGGDGSIIEGMLLHGGGGTVDGSTGDLLKSGIRLRARATIRDCYIRSFAGAGLCISAAVAGGDPSAPFYGNANNWRVDTVRVERNKAGGLFVSGGDANAGTAIGVDASFNGRFGIYDSAFLGNTYIGCHADSNGQYGDIAGSTETSTVSHGGNRYYCVDGTLAAATEPGTDGAVWMALGAGGVSTRTPAWSALGNYVGGGSYFQSGSANACTFTGCYYETGQAPPQISGAAIVLGGFMGNGLPTAAPHLRAVPGTGLTAQLGFGQDITYADASWAKHRLGGDMSGSALELLTWNSSLSFPTDPNRKSSLTHDKVTGDVTWNSYNARNPLRLTGYSTARSYGGKSQAECRHVVEIRDLALGADDAARIMTSGNAAPTTGYHAKGEIVWNNGATINPQTTNFWFCTASGTPGTWGASSNLSGSGAIGYQAGAGGAVTQNSGKATGVTLHKPCGKVVMNAEALAAGAAVSFTLTSNFISAADTVVVNISSGARADSYEAGVTALGLTTARIQLRNISAGSLAEAVVLNFAVVKAVTA